LELKLLDQHPHPLPITLTNESVYLHAREVTADAGDLEARDRGRVDTQGAHQRSAKGSRVFGLYEFVVIRHGPPPALRFL
jgi:hypothetical protein